MDVLTEAVVSAIESDEPSDAGVTCGPAKHIKNSVVIGSIALAVYWVIFGWGMWSGGLSTLGINAALLLLGLGAVLEKSSDTKHLTDKRNLYWVIPLLCIAISYSLYENPFIKLAHLLVLPLALCVFSDFSRLERGGHILWRVHILVSSLLAAFFHPIIELSAAVRAHLKCLTPVFGRIDSPSSGSRKALKGLFILTALSIFLVIPLLSSADREFGLAVSEAFEWISSIIQQDFILRVLFLIVMSIGLTSFVVSVGEARSPSTTEQSAPPDQIVAGIVLGGILGFYLLFLWIQFARLWNSDLPLEFGQAESLVKGGFWQLIALSLLNIGLFTWTYRCSGSTSTNLLRSFTVASLLLVGSSANRMYLYVTLYGLSYEKFFASYAVLYCVTLFALLLSAHVAAKRIDVVKTTLTLFIWMYGIVSLLPVERIIWSTNLALSTRPSSRIHLSDMRMLSADVLPLVQSSIARGEIVVDSLDYDWYRWISARECELQKKKWFEHTVSSIAAVTSTPIRPSAMSGVQQ